MDSESALTAPCAGETEHIHEKAQAKSFPFMLFHISQTMQPRTWYNLRMEKRGSKRRGADLEARLVSRSLNYTGMIRDFAADGICMDIPSEKNICQLLNGMFFEVHFGLPSGETINLQCKVVRTHRETADDRENRVAMKIIDPPPAYGEFLKSLP